MSDGKAVIGAAMIPLLLLPVWMLIQAAVAARASRRREREDLERFNAACEEHRMKMQIWENGERRDPPPPHPPPPQVYIAKC